jgi:hypothetical protein
MLVNVLKTVDATDNLETLVYCCGALKNMSNKGAFALTLPPPISDLRSIS